MWAWIAIAALIILAALLVAAAVTIHRAGPILKARITETLSARFNSRVELDNLSVSVFRGLEVSGNRLRLYPRDNAAAAGARLPLIAIDRFSFHSGLTGLFVEPIHIGLLQVDGLQIDIPPPEMRRQASEKPKRNSERSPILVDAIVCHNSRLIIGTAKPDKDATDFELKRIELRNVGGNAPWQYDATITNVVPRGEVHAAGTFGPWQTRSPGDSSVTGHYTFDYADLNTIKGLGGILSSVGDFKGQLDKIVIDGTTKTRDFSLDVGSHPMPLRTRFHAIVDGISGDTYLESVNANLRNSSLETSGTVINIKGRGHTIDLDVAVLQGQVQDFLDLAVKTDRAFMTGAITTRTKLHIRPGKESVAQRMRLQGAFTLSSIRFTNPQLQDKIDMLSLRAQGEPKKARPGAQDVDSQMTGAFSLNEGLVQFSNLAYVLPGARVNLKGMYCLDGHQLAFNGKVFTDASLSRMVDSPWLSVLLKAASPFLKKTGKGAEIPVKITGDKSAPKFAFDVFGGHSKEAGDSGNRQR